MPVWAKRFGDTKIVHEIAVSQYQGIKLWAEAVKKAGKPADLIKGEGYNHFEFIETLANPHGQLGRAALEQMKLAAG